jgi:hypothetical protein
MTPTPNTEESRAEHERVGEERDYAEHRLAALARAVREHEDTARGHVTQSARAHDRRLYRRLREICAERSGR